MVSKITDLSLLREKLTVSEQKTMTVGPAITTVTFMSGDASMARVALKGKLAEIISANPWLMGTLEKGDLDGSLYLAYPKSLADSSAAVAGLLDPTTRGGMLVEKSLMVESTMSYFEICEAVSGTSAEILKGSQCIGNGEPLVALTVVADSEHGEDLFAIVFSCSHVIMDGFTYYRLLNMLSKNVSVEILSPKRKHSIMEQAQMAIGLKEFKWMNSLPVICNVIGSMLCGSKPLIESYYIDNERVKNRKAEAVSNGHGSTTFVSTNDVIASSFGIVTNADALLLPLNFRGRLPDFDARDAGNYEGALYFGRGDFEDPTLIRQTLQSGPPTYARSKGTTPLPGVFTTCCCSKFSMVTNWAFPFFEELDVEGGQQIVHLPHCDTKMVPFDIAVVYRPTKGRLAVVYFVRSVNRSGLVAELPMGAVVPTPDQMWRDTIVMG